MLDCKVLAVIIPPAPADSLAYAGCDILRSSHIPTDQFLATLTRLQIRSRAWFGSGEHLTLFQSYVKRFRHCRRINSFARRTEATTTRCLRHEIGLQNNQQKPSSRLICLRFGSLKETLQVNLPFGPFPAIEAAESRLSLRSCNSARFGAGNAIDSPRHPRNV